MHESLGAPHLGWPCLGLGSLIVRQGLYKMCGLACKVDLNNLQYIVSANFFPRCIVTVPYEFSIHVRNFGFYYKGNSKFSSNSLYKFKLKVQSVVKTILCQLTWAHISLFFQALSIRVQIRIDLQKNTNAFVLLTIINYSQSYLHANTIMNM